MIKRRENIFETNSSSMHSIVVSSIDRGYNYDLPVTKDGILYVNFGEFGWGPEILKYPIEKLSYYITDQFGGFRDEDTNFDSIVCDILEDPRMKGLIEILKAKVPGFKKLELGPAEYCRFGYVDHQSSGLTSGKNVADLIFNSSIIIVIDNDNSYHFDDYYEADIYQKGGKPNKKEELWNM